MSDPIVLTDATDVPRLLLTAAEAARSLAISERTLWSLTNRRIIPCVRIGRCVRYDPRNLRSWLDTTAGGKA